MKFGAGFMQCRVKGGGYYLLPLHSPEEVGRAEKLLREKLLSGELEEIDTRLTRWNREKKQVERVLGKGSKRPW